MDEIRPNLIFDVGLHMGEDTAYYLAKGFDVVAFEANPGLIAHCKARFQDAIAQGRLRIMEGAIASPQHGDTLTFYVNKKSSVWGTIESDWVQRNERLGTESEAIMVPRVDVGAAYRTFGVPHYLKIDIEGADRVALDELKKFSARPQYVSVESEKVDFEELRAEFDLLSALGYAKFKAVQQATIPGTIFKGTALDGSAFEYHFEKHASGPFGDDIAQPWVGMDEVLREYGGIFDRYRRFGKEAPRRKRPGIMRKLDAFAYRWRTGYRGKLPGWYDTHASL